MSSKCQGNVKQMSRGKGGLSSLRSLTTFARSARLFSATLGALTLKRSGFAVAPPPGGSGVTRSLVARTHPYSGTRSLSLTMCAHCRAVRGYAPTRSSLPCGPLPSGGVDPASRGASPSRSRARSLRSAKLTRTTRATLVLCPLGRSAPSGRYAPIPGSAGSGSRLYPLFHARLFFGVTNNFSLTRDYSSYPAVCLERRSREGRMRGRSC